jgi:hypothetical protein
MGTKFAISQPDDRQDGMAGLIRGNGKKEKDVGIRGGMHNDA